AAANGRTSPADEEATPGAGPPSLAAEEGKPDHFGTCAMSGTVGPAGSWSDYNHYEVSVTVANPRAVFGRDAIDMMGSMRSIATSAPGRSARRKWFNPGIPSLHPRTQRPPRPPCASARPPT